MENGLVEERRLKMPTARALGQLSCFVLFAACGAGQPNVTAPASTSSTLGDAGTETEPALPDAGGGVMAIMPPRGARSTISSSVHVAMGIPKDGDDSDDYLMDKGVYVVSYNKNLNAPNWSSWQLDAKYVGNVDRQNDFRADDALPADFYHVTPQDYANSGFDRGHLCPSKDRSDSAENNSLTFLMTNMHPQRKELNEVRWKNLEDYSRKLATDGHKELYIMAGGIFDAHPAVIGHGVAVPKADYKIVVVLDAGQGVDNVSTGTEVIAVMMPNESSVKNKKWTEYLVTVDDVERQTGYDFLSNVPADVQRVIQSKKATIAIK